jgi:hypothetical protein
MAVKLKGLPPSSFPPWEKIFPAWEENVPSIIRYAKKEQVCEKGSPNNVRSYKKTAFIQTFS